MRFVPMLVAAGLAGSAAAEEFNPPLPAWAPGAARRICEAYRDEPLSLERLADLLGRPVTERSLERDDRMMRARFVLESRDVVTVVTSLFGTDRQRVVLIGASRRSEAQPIPTYAVSVAPDCTLA